MAGPQPKDWIAAIHPYVPGKSTTDSGAKAAKLSSNENPLGTSDKARAAFAAQAGGLDRYPEGGATASDIRFRTNTLEDVFLKLTGRSLRED